MKILIKKTHPDAITPKFAHESDAGLDFYAIKDKIINPGERVKLPTGIAMELPIGYVALIWDKSGLAAKHGIKTMGGVGDCSYRGEYHIILLNTSNEPYVVKKGDKIAQFLIQKVENPEIIEVEELSNTKRGKGGFGSTGK